MIYDPASADRRAAIDLELARIRESYLAEDGRLEGVLPLLLQHDILRTTQAENAVVIFHAPADVEEEQDASLSTRDDEGTSDAQEVQEYDNPRNGCVALIP